MGKVGEKYTFIDNNSFSRATLNLAASHSRTNFLTTQKSFINPSNLLSMGHATLHSINKSEAIFCISDKTIRVTDSSVGPFLWSSAFLNVKELVILPLCHLKTLALKSGNIDKSSVQISFIHMTGRCGSTLLGQMLEKVPNTLVLSERGEISSEDYKDILHAVFSIICSYLGLRTSRMKIMNSDHPSECCI